MFRRAVGAADAAPVKWGEKRGCKATSRISGWIARELPRSSLKTLFCGVGGGSQATLRDLNFASKTSQLGDPSWIQCFPPSDTLKRGSRDALENLHVQGENPSRNRCCLGRGFGCCLRFYGNFAGGSGRFLVILFSFPPPFPSLSSPFPFPTPPSVSRTLKGYRVTALDRHRSG